jgi:hypothetical protein
LRIDNLIFMKTTMTHTFFPRWNTFLKAAMGAIALALLAACGGGGGARGKMDEGWDEEYGACTCAQE